MNSAPRCAGGNGRPAHKAVWMRFAGYEGSSAVHVCPRDRCGNKALNGMIQQSTAVVARPKLDSDVIELETTKYVPMYRPSPPPSDDVVLGTLVVGGLIGLAVGVTIATRRRRRLRR